MTDTKKTAANHTALHDTLGIVLIVAGALLGVAAFMYIKNGAVENPTMFTATMSWLVEAIGPPAILWLCLGFLFVGARLFLFGNERGSWRDPVGFVATALGLSILMGAIRPESIALGGYWGQKIGGRVSEMGTVAAGVALGLASLLIPAWVVWLRVAPPALIAKANALIGEAPASETEAVSSPQRTTRSATAAKKATEDPSGVTSAEADALLPDAERDEILFALRSANRNTATTANHAPSPYPADVRRDGGIPSGARPIETTHEPRRAAPLADQGAAIIRPTAAPIAGHVPAPGGGSAGGAGPVRTWSAPKSVPSEVSAGADLAPTKDARSVGATSRPASAPELKPAAVEATAKQTLATPAQPPQIGGTAQVARAIPIPSDAGPIGTPTWESDEDLEEQDAVTDDEAVEPEDELVVDAYGTPLELVAALRGETVVTAELQAPPAESEIASDEDEDDFEEVLESDAVE